MQPALYEAFGLTVIEAMTCGLPTFATSKGGPAEIIVHGESQNNVSLHTLLTFNKGSYTICRDLADFQIPFCRTGAHAPKDPAFDTGLLPACQGRVYAMQ